MRLGASRATPPARLGHAHGDASADLECRQAARYPGLVLCRFVAGFDIKGPDGADHGIRLPLSGRCGVAFPGKGAARRFYCATQRDREFRRAADAQDVGAGFPSADTVSAVSPNRCFGAGVSWQLILVAKKASVSCVASDEIDHCPYIKLLSVLKRAATSKLNAATDDRV